MKKNILGGLLLILLLLCTTGLCDVTKADTISVIDGADRSVNVPCPPERIVSTAASASELICILNGKDSIVGRDKYSTFPPVLEDIPVVGSYSKTINVELVLDQNPDLVIADTSILPVTIEQIETAGVPVLIVGRNCQIEPVIYNIRLIGQIMDDEETAEELIEFMEGYLDLIEERTKDLKDEEKPLVYHECREYKSNANGTPKDQHIIFAGGINIAHEDEVERPIVSGEWVLERNPEIIISKVSSSAPATEEVLKEKRDELLSRPGLVETEAVLNGDVYVYHTFLRRGPRLPGYLLCFAKWFHPELFEDVDPMEMERELLDRFYDLELEGTWAYPTH